MRSKLLAKTYELIKECDGLLITAGAGMGVDSGLPDYRGKNVFIFLIERGYIEIIQSLEIISSNSLIVRIHCFLKLIQI